jgi:subtilisin-like proprotein convertase family protein
VTDNKPVEDVNVTLNINHTWVGDLIARLISPANDTVVLFEQPGIPGSDFGCDSDNMAVVLDDEAANDYAVLDGQCNGTPPAVSGIFKAAGLLAGQDGASAQGDWRLLVTDTYNEDGGAITAWSISLCFPELIDAAVLLNNSPLVVGNGGTAAPGTSNLELVLSGDAAQGIYTLLSLPTHGTLNLNGTTLSIGSTFTQADINSGALSYINNGDQSASDSFTFDVQDSANDHWLHNNLFNIIIAENNLSVTATQTQAVSCYNGNTGEITATAAGLDGNYTYSLNGGARQASNIFSGLSAGNYTVTVHGQFGLTASSQIIVLDNPAPVSASASTFLFDITVTAGGGTGVYEYSTDGANFQSNNVLTVSANGIYTVTVRDENGCTATTEVIVAVNQIIATATVTDNVTCAGGDNGSISVTAAGGEGPLSYALNGGTAQSSSVFTGLTAGAYTVQVSDSLGLSATTSEVIILEPAALQLTVASALNTVTATATGGTGALQYSINGVDYQNSGEFTGLVNGDYIITVQDANGCTATTTVIVDIPILTLSLNFSASLFCAGDASGFITVLANGGIPPYSYSLNGGPEQTDNTFVGLQAGNYNITVRDAFNQELSYTVTITEPAPITGTATVVLNDVTLNISGGTPPYSFSNNNLQDLPNGSYSVTVTDGNGCSGIISFVVDVPPVTISATVTNVTCFGDSNGSISLFAAGGIPPYTLNGQPFVQGTAINNLAAGSYTVTILDSAGNESTSSFTVGSPAQLVVTATLNGNTITASATGGTGSYVFLLNGVAGIGNVFSNLPLGNYTVGVVDANGCAATINTPLVISSVVEPSEEWGLTVSPNPGTGLFVLTMNHAPEVLRAEVFDASGRMLRTLDFAPGGGTFSATVDIRELPDGNYILRLTDGKRWGGVRLSKAE